MTRVCAAALACALAAPAVLGGGSTSAASTIGYAPSSPSLFLDEEWYRSNLIKAADLWNGGLDGEGGMGTYRKDFDGFFQVNLDRAWHPRPGMPSTSVAQSRAIYMNVEAYRAAGPTLTPNILDKGHIWKTNYHYTMFFAEALRLCKEYRVRVESLNAEYRRVKV